MSHPTIYTPHDNLNTWLKANVGLDKLAELAEHASNPYDLERVMTTEEVSVSYGFYSDEMWKRVFELAREAGQEILEFMDVCYIEDYEQLQAVVAGFAIIDAARRMVGERHMT